MKQVDIKSIDRDEDIFMSAKVIRDAFRSVAELFDLTIDNAPSNAAFISEDKLYAMKESGITLFGAFEGEKQVGFVSVEKANDTVFYLEKLAVLPEHRHKGFGKILMDHVFDYVRAQGGKRISIGIINENTVLKNWYEAYGFGEVGVKTYEHLPFTVCIMEKDVYD